MKSTSQARKRGSDSESAPELDRYESVQMLRLPEVASRTTLSCAQIYKIRKINQFPDPSELGARARAWPEYRVDAWLFSRMELRSAMKTLTEPVELPLWTPELEMEALANAPVGIERSAGRRCCAGSP